MEIVAYSAILIVLGCFLFWGGPIRTRENLYLSTRNTKIQGGIIFFCGIGLFLGDRYHFPIEGIALLVLGTVMWSCLNLVPLKKLPERDKYVFHKRNNTTFARWVKGQNLLVKLAIAVLIIVVVGWGLLYPAILLLQTVLLRFS